MGKVKEFIRTVVQNIKILINDKKDRVRKEKTRNKAVAARRPMSAADKKKAAAKREEKRLAITAIAIAVVVIIGISIFSINRWNNRFSYEKCLDETLFIYSDKEVELRAVTYYIMVEEEAVNQAAQAYDPLNTNAYWGLHLNEGFVKDKAKETALNYCVRDILYAQVARENELRLSEEVIADLELKAKEIYNGLTQKQLDLGMTEDDIYQALYNNKLADEWVLLMAKKDKVTISEAVLSARYGINSYYFKTIKVKYGFQLNEELWAEISLGHLTLE